MDQMADVAQPPLTDALFETEEASNIVSPLVAQESGIDHDKCEMVCGGVAWTWACQESDTTQLSSVENIFGVLDTHVHTTHHYTHQLLQLTLQATTCTMQLSFSNYSHFTCECCINEGVECLPNSGGPMEEMGNPPDTQLFVCGLMAFKANC